MPARAISARGGVTRAPSRTVPVGRVERRAIPVGTTVAGVASASDGTGYLTTRRGENRGDVLWRVAGPAMRAVASRWRGAGGVLLYAAPDR